MLHVKRKGLDGEIVLINKDILVSDMTNGASIKSAFMCISALDEQNGIVAQEKIDMDTSEKLIKMYELLHGKMSRNFGLDVWFDENGDAAGVVCTKDGNESWRMTKEELLFDYVTRDWKVEDVHDEK
jgi:hypothetical protein